MRPEQAPGGTSPRAPGAPPVRTLSAQGFTALGGSLFLDSLKCASWTAPLLAEDTHHKVRESATRPVPGLALSQTGQPQVLGVGWGGPGASHAHREPSGPRMPCMRHSPSTGQLGGEEAAVGMSSLVPSAVTSDWHS